MLAKDIMTTNVVTVEPNEDVCRLARLLLDRRISAAPVVDGRGKLCGIVSEGDLMRRAECCQDRSWWLALLADDTTEFTRTFGTRVRDVMTCEVVSVEEQTPVSEIARILETRRIKRLPVIREGQLVGIVSRADVLHALAAVDFRSVALPTTNDREIRSMILELIRQKTSASLQAVSVIVINGVVYLWGIAQTQADKDAIRVAAENVAGVTKVHDFLNTMKNVLSNV